MKNKDESIRAEFEFRLYQRTPFLESIVSKRQAECIDRRKRQ
jgi:hypothetical protein